SPDSSLGPPPPLVIPQVYMRLGQRYHAALTTLSPLFNELDNVRSAEPSAALDATRNALAAFGNATNAVANELLTGAATDPAPFNQMASALNSLASAIGQLDGSARFQHAARELGYA